MKFFLFKFFSEISPIHPEEDILAAQPPENLQPKPVKRERSLDRDSTVMTPELKYKVPKTEMMSPSDRHEERRRDARLYEMDRDRRKVCNLSLKLLIFIANLLLIFIAEIIG